MLIGGDTHVERLEYRDGVLLINSGSPSLPHHFSTRLGTVGHLTIEHGRIEAEIFALGPTPGQRNPGRPQRVVIEHGRVVEATLCGETLTEAEFLKPPGERTLSNGAS